jgi:microcystin-dependent protein
MPFYLWSRTAGTNANADPTVNWAEGMAPSAVNDSARAGNARLREFADDIAGAKATGGSSTAYTLATYQAFDTLAHLAGNVVAFTPHTTNGATVTLNVDGLGAKPLRSAPSVELPAGVLIQGTPYAALYNNATQEFFLHGFYGNPYGIPIGGGLPFFLPTAPNSSFVFPFGQAISRTTYATLFASMGTAHGVGDGSTTFNLPDLRGRVLAGKDDMGGGAANRITLAGSGILGTLIGSAGGAETATIAQGNLPNYTLPNTLSIANPTLTIDGAYRVASSFNGITQSGGLNNVLVSDGSSAPSGHINNPAIAGSVTSGGSGTPTNNMPPAMIANFIMRII